MTRLTNGATTTLVSTRTSTASPWMTHGSTGRQVLSIPFDARERLSERSRFRPSSPRRRCRDQSVRHRGGRRVPLLDEQGRDHWLGVQAATRQHLLDVRDSHTPDAAKVIATQQDAPYQLAIDADYVYWVNTVASGAVVAASKTANVAQALAMDQNMPFGLVSDSVHVFWVNSGDGTVRSLPAGIGSATPTTIAIGQSNPVRVAVTGSAVFWTDDVATGSVMRTSTP